MSSPTHQYPREADQGQPDTEHEEDDEDGESPADGIVVNLHPGLLGGDQPGNEAHDDGHQGGGEDHDLPPAELVEEDRAERGPGTPSKGRHYSDSLRPA